MNDTKQEEKQTQQIRRKLHTLALVKITTKTIYPNRKLIDLPTKIRIYIYIFYKYKLEYIYKITNMKIHPAY